MVSQSTITCPSCKTSFPIEAALKGDLEKQINEQLRNEYNQKFKSIQQEKEQEFDLKLKKHQDENTAILQKKSAEMVEQIKQNIQIEHDELILALKKDNEEQTAKISDLRKKEIEFMQKERALKEEKDNMEIAMKKWAIEKAGELEDKIKKEEIAKNELKFREYDKQLDDQKKLVEEMRRKAEQGSMQLQGEVQELAIEEWIENKFPLDKLEEIKKGARGGDCIQVVKNNFGQECGKIYYESKRTKEFSATWIEKFKVDMRDINADIGVIVTQTMPKDMDRFGEREGIWICTYEEFKALSFVLRDSLLKMQSVKISQENRGEKMSILYDYLTSPAFRMSIESIVEGFTGMQDNLAREKRSMQALWKTREKQIEKVMISTIDMFGTVKGIAGSAIQDIKLLDLDEGLLLEDGE